MGSDIVLQDDHEALSEEITLGQRPGWREGMTDHVCLGERSFPG